MSRKCCCSEGPSLIVPCSGGADVGIVADQAGRKLTREGAGKIYYLAGIGGRISSILKTTEAAGRILAINGCAQDCVSNCLEQAGFTRFDHFGVTDLGLEKGGTPVTQEAFEKVAAKGREILAKEANA